MIDTEAIKSGNIHMKNNKIKFGLLIPIISDQRFIIFIILVTGLILRLNGIFWGLPNSLHPSFSYHPDEIYLLSWADMLLHQEIIPRHFLYGGTFYYITLHLTNWLGILYTDTFGGMHLYNIMLMGRIIGVLYALLTIVIVFQIGRTLFNHKVGLLAAFLLSIMPAHIFWAQRIRPDELFALEFSIIFLFTARILKSKGSYFFNLTAGGFCLGIAVATRFPAGILLVPFLTAIFFYHKLNGKFIDIIKESAFLVLMTCLGYLLASPHSIIYSDMLISGLHTQWNYQSEIFEDAFNRGPVWFQYGGRILIQALGLSFYILFLPSLVFACFLKKREDLLLLAMALPYFLLLANTSWVVTRYTIPLLPTISILIAHLLYHSRLLNRAKKMSVAFILLIAISWTIASNFAYSNSLNLDDPRDVASKWIMNNIHQKAKIGAFISYQGDFFNNPPPNRMHQWNYCNLKEDSINHFLDNAFDYIVMNMNQLENTMRLKEHSPNKAQYELYQWSQQHRGYRVIKTFSNKISFAGIDFQKFFSSRDYLISQPKIVIYIKNIP